MTTSILGRWSTARGLAILCAGLAIATLAPMAGAQEGPGPLAGEPSSTELAPLPAEMDVVPMTSEEALAASPNVEQFTVAVRNQGLPPDAPAEILKLVADAIGQDTFHGAVFAFVPQGASQLSIHIQSAMHTPQAAEAAALKLCEEARGENDSRCTLLARITPLQGEEDGAPSLSAPALRLFAQGLSELEPPRFVARSRSTKNWSMWRGEGRGRAALDECNAAVVEANGEPDCELVVNDEL